MKVDGLVGQQLIDFCRMMASDSIVESFQDEFDMSAIQIKDCMTAINSRASSYGGVYGLVKHLEGKVETSSKVRTTPQNTQEGLRDRLFETMDALRSGNIKAGDAKTLAVLAKEICNSQRTEIDVINKRAENAKVIKQLSGRNE